MKRALSIIIVFVTLGSYKTICQSEYDTPKLVAQNFLDLCLKGERLIAAKKYATVESMGEIEVLLKQMIMNDKALKNDKCKYLVESCEQDSSKMISNCYFKKVCENSRENSKGVLVLKYVDEKWLVEYIYKRDKYL